LVAACGAGTSDRTSERSDSAGIEIVRYAGPDRPLAWSFDTVLVLGGAESGPQSFYQLGHESVGTDDAGSIYVLDRAAGRVVAFSGDGTVLRTMGQSGGGPGEFHYPWTLGVTGDGLVSVLDLGKRALVRFGPDAAVLNQVPVPHSWGSGRLVERHGAIVYPRDVSDPDGPRVESLVRATPHDTVEIARFVREPPRAVQFQSCGMMVSGMPRIFDATMVWTPMPAGFAVAGTPAYEIVIHGDTAGPHRIVRRAIDPIPATRDLAQASLGEGMRFTTPSGSRVCDADEALDQRGVAPVIPAVLQLGHGPGGTLWVERNLGPGAPQPIDVYGADGAYLGTLDAGAPFPVLAWATRMAAIVTDENDVARLVVFEVGR
jgi:hypothetical protein